MRDRVTGKRIENHTTPEEFDKQTEEIEAVVSDQAKEQQELEEEALGDFIGDEVAVTQHELGEEYDGDKYPAMICIQCGKNGGTLSRVGTGMGREATYKHANGCDVKPFDVPNRETRRKLGMR